MNNTRSKHAATGLRPTGLGLAMLLAAILTASAPLGRGAGANQTLRAALGPFSTDDGYVRSVLAAGDFVAALQARLDDLPGMDWVERQQINHALDELNMGQMSLLSGGAVLRLGQWVKADFLVLGRFERPPGQGRVLRLEIVELDRADVLATRTIPIAGDRRDPVPVRAADIQTAAGEIKAALSEARGKLDSFGLRLVIAPLFFRNVDPSPRLDLFEEELLAAFAQAAARSSGVRALRFPRAMNSKGEAELVLHGLVAADPEAWTRMADGFVWGSYHELKAANAGFEQTPVELTLSLWNGSGDPVQIVQRGVVAERRQLALRMAGACFEFFQTNRPGARPPAARKQAAKWLLERSSDIAKTSANLAGIAGFAETPEARALARHRMELVETACFLAPEDRTAREQRFRLAWPGFPYSSISVWDVWPLLDELDGFVADPGRLPDGSLDLSYRQERVRALEYLVTQFSMENNLPIDARSEVVEQWRAELGSRLAKSRADLEEQQRKQKGMAAAAARTNAIQTLAPAKPAASGPPSRGPAGPPPIRPNAGLPTGATLVGPTIPVLHPVVRFPPLPSGMVYQIGAMIEADHALWVSAEVAAPLPFALPAGQAPNVFLRYDPAQESCLDLAERTGPHSEMTAFLPRDGMLWITLALDGVWKFSPAKLDAEKFGIQDGLVTPAMNWAAAAGTNLFFGGERDHQPLVSMLGVASTNWRRLEVPIPAAPPPASPVNRPGMRQDASDAFRQAFTFDHWLLLGPGPWTLLDLDSGTSTNLGLAAGLKLEPPALDPQTARRTIQFRRPGPPEELLRACASSPDGFWLGLATNLALYNPSARSVLSVGAPFEDLTCLADDGEFVWAAVCPGRISLFARSGTRVVFPSNLLALAEARNSKILVFHKPTRRWVGCFTVPGQVSSLCAAELCLYLGETSGTHPIVEVDKQSILDELRVRALPDANHQPQKPL